MAEPIRVLPQPAQRPQAPDAPRRPEASRTPPAAPRLGQVLVESGLLAWADLHRAIEEQQRRPGVRLGDLLVAMGLVAEEDVAISLAIVFELPFVDLDDTVIEITAFEQVPAKLVETYRILPIACRDRTVTAAVCDPLALEALDLLSFSTGKKIQQVMVTPSQLDRHLALQLPFLKGGSPAEKAVVVEGESEEEIRARTPTASDDATDDTVVRLVERIIVDAVRRGASDIHLEPNGADAAATVRFRIDGACQTFWRIPAERRHQVISRVKILAALDITERRLPQDGKIKLQVDGERVELRVASVPTRDGGEDLVLRVLRHGATLQMHELDLDRPNRDRLRELVQQPHGLLLVVGPTGSGKTTTLHALLGSINTDERKIWSAEDPVEIVQPGIRQVQVRRAAGFTFAHAMRAFLRADPDVIMIGEMRDPETAGIAVEASLTGHLVLSTLHTNSAPETVTRLLDMGLEPFTFSDALLGVLAQRLVRRLCRGCRREREANAEEIAELASLYGEGFDEILAGGRPMLSDAVGCPQCDRKGYRGRLAVHELLVNDQVLRGAIQRRRPADEVRALATAGGMRALLQDGIAKCLQGLTDLKQVLAVCAPLTRSTPAR